MQLSVCIITKNECTKLEHCLNALKPYGIELVVVDTGSTDGTRAMLKQYTDAVYEFAWIDNFAAAKNYAVMKATHDFVFVVDSDEYLCQANIVELLQMVNRHSNGVGRVKRINQVTRNGEHIEYQDWTNRIFDRRKFHFEGKIHEQLVPGSVFDAKNYVAGFEVKYETYTTNLVLDHDGYEGSAEERRKKAERNKKLLLEELKAEPQDTYLLYQLGKSCYMAGEYEEAVRYFDKATSFDVNPQLEYVIDMVETYGYAMINSNQFEKALLLAGVYEEFGNSADFQFLMGLIYMNNGLFEKAVFEFQKAAEHETAKASGVNSYLAYYNAGVICETLGDRKKAADYYEKCGDYKRARERFLLVSEEMNQTQS